VGRMMFIHLFGEDRTLFEFCYGVYNQCESFIYLDLMVKNREVHIERYFKWWTSTKLVWVRYQNY
jgi:hypothetical protein